MTQIQRRKNFLPNLLLIITIMVLLFSACTSQKKNQAPMRRFHGGFDEYGTIIFSYKDKVSPEKLSSDIDISKQFFQTSIDEYNSRNNLSLRLGFTVDTLRMGLRVIDPILYYRVKAIFQPIPYTSYQTMSLSSDSSTTTPQRPCGPRPGTFNKLEGVSFSEIYSDCY
jgi:hypothetical protein